MLISDSEYECWMIFADHLTRGTEFFVYWDDLGFPKMESSGAAFQYSYKEDAESALETLLRDPYLNGYTKWRLVKFTGTEE